MNKTCITLQVNMNMNEQGLRFTGEYDNNMPVSISSC